MRKVLVGEGNYAEFEILNDFLSTRGFDVHWVKTGPEAVTQFSELKPDLVILDALLPGLTGLKVCQKIRTLPEGDSVKTILLSTVYKQFKEKYDERKTAGVDAYSGKPVDVSELEKLITSIMGDPQSRDKGQSGTEKPMMVGRKEVGPSGTFETTSFPKILFLLKKFKRTGALEVEHERINKVIYVNQGKLAYVSSNQSSESLGRFMVQADMLSVSDYNASLENMLSTGNQQGRVLLDMGVVTPHQLYEALRGHLMEKITSIFAWETGRFAFRSGRLKLDQSLVVDIDLQDAIYRGIKKFYSLARLENYFNEYKNHRIFKIEDSLYDRKELVLKPNQASFLNTMEADQTLGRVVAGTKMTLTETFQLLYLLLLVEEIRFEGDTDLGERSVARQEEFLENRRLRRRAMRESTMESDISGVNQVARYRKDVDLLFEQIGDLTHFDLLGVFKDADIMEIKTAYYKMVKLYHPSELYSQTDDITKAKADGIFNALTQAYEVLTDEKARGDYLEYIKDMPEKPAFHEAEPEIEIASDDADVADEELIPEQEDEQEEEYDFDAVPDFTEEFDFGEEPKPSDDISPDVIDPEISWDEEDFTETDDEDDDKPVDFSFETPEDTEQELQIEQGRQVTMDMAAVVKSELAFQNGEDYLLEGDYESAAASFRQAIETNPNEAEYYAYLAWSVFNCDNSDPENVREAFDAVDKGLSINPNLDTAYYYMGMIFATQGNGEKARLNFQKALQFNPENENAQKALEELEN